MGGKDWLLLLGFMGVAIAIRLHGLSASNLWLDEANSWQVASGSWSKLVGELRGSPVGPLYFVLLKLWISGLGDSAFALRAFSVLASILLIPATYALGARLLSRPAGLIAAALLALSPLELYFAQEARMYMLTSLIALLTLWAYASWRETVVARSLSGSVLSARVRPETVPLLLYTMAAITLLFTHPVAGTLLVAINLDALMAWWRARNSGGAMPAAGIRRATIISWIAAQVVIGAVIILYLAFLHLDSAASSQAWRTGLSLERALRAALLLPFSATAGQRFYPTDFWFALSDLAHARGSLSRLLVLLIVQPLTLLVFVLAADASVRAQLGTHAPSLPTDSNPGARRLLLTALVIPLLFAVVISLSRSLETERYFLFVVPFFFLVLADGLVEVRQPLRNASLVVLGAALLLGTRATKAAVSRDSDYRSTAALIDGQRRPGDRIMIQPREMNAPLRFYLHSRTDSIIGLRADASVGEELAKLSPGRTWVVIDYRSPLYGLAPQELAAALHASLERDAYTSDASAGVRVALVDTRTPTQ